MVGKLLFYVSTARNKKSCPVEKEHPFFMFLTLKTHYVLLDILEELKLDLLALSKLNYIQTPALSRAIPQKLWPTFNR